MLASMQRAAITSAMAAQSSEHDCGCEEDDVEAAEGPAFTEAGLTGDEVADPLPLARTGRGVGPALPLPLLGVVAGEGAGVLTDVACEVLGDSMLASAAAALAITP